MGVACTIMVELDVRVERGGVFISGEMVHCTLTFTNSSKKPQTVAWASAQIHCQMLAKTELVRVKDKEVLQSPVTDTAFFPNRGKTRTAAIVVLVLKLMGLFNYVGERGLTLLSTDSKVLLCNVTLKPGEIKKCKNFVPIR